MSKVTIIFALLFICPSLYSQQKVRKIHSGNVISASLSGSAFMSGSNLNKNGTRWTQVPGYGWFGSGGVQLNIENDWAVDLDFGIDNNFNFYDNLNLRLKVSYMLPFVDIKVSKFFKRSGTGKFWVTKLGGAVHLANGKIIEKEEFNYNYLSTISSKPVFSIIPEIGTFKKPSGNQSYQFTLYYNFSFMNLMSTELTAYPELYAANAITKGGYIGFSFKYFLSQTILLVSHFKVFKQ